MDTQTEKQDIINFSGFFEPEQLQNFLNPLIALSYLMKSEGIVLNISKEKTLSIYALNPAEGFLGAIHYKSKLFSNFNIEENLEVGIIRLNEFVKFFSILDNKSNVYLEIHNGNKIILRQNGSGEVSYRAADISLIRQAPKKTPDIKIYSSLDISEFTKLKKAMAVLSDEDCLFVSGDSEKNKISLNLRSDQVEMNAYKLKIDCPVSENFETIYKKPMWEVVLTLSLGTITANFSDRLVRFDCEDDNVSIKFYVAKKAINK